MSTTENFLDPDVRFILANERTLLAWIRTSLTMQAGGIALAHFASDTPLGTLTGIAAIVAGGALAVIGYSRFRAADKAIRAHKLPRVGRGPKFEVTVVVTIAVVLALAQAFDLL